MDMTEQAVGDIAFAGDIAKVQHGTYFADVDYFYFAENNLDVVSTIEKHCPVGKPFFTARNTLLQTGYPDESCAWDIDSNLVKFGQVADGTMVDISAYMQYYYDLNVSYFPNFAGLDQNTLDFVQTCKYIDISQFDKDFDVYRASVSAVQYTLKHTAGFSRVGHRVSAWSILPVPTASSDLTAPGNDVLMTSDMSCYAIWIQQCNVQLNCFPLCCKAEILSPAPIDGQYDLGATLALSAIPADWYTFDVWKIGSKTLSGVSASYMLTSANTNIDAYFRPIRYKLKIEFSHLPGIIKCKDGDAEQTISAKHEFEVTHFSKFELSAQNSVISDDNSTFCVWQSDDIAISDPTRAGLIVSNASKDITVSAAFYEDGSVVKVVRNNQNFGAVWICSDTSSDWIETDYYKARPGDSVALSAAPADYCEFVQWKTATEESSSVVYKLSNIVQPTIVSAYFDTWLVANDYEQPIVYVSNSISGNIDDTMTKI